MTAPFMMPHWSDKRVVAVATAIWDDNSIHSPLTFPRDEAVKYWPGIDARRFVAMSDALAAPASDTPARYEPEASEPKDAARQTEGAGQ
jgi:hypothetical protein